MKWSEKDIKELRRHAYKVFKTEIPLSREIEKIQIFLDHSDMGFTKARPILIKTVQTTVQWFPNFWHYPMEVDIPESVLAVIREQCSILLNQKCDELAGLCGYTQDYE